MAGKHRCVATTSKNRKCKLNALEGQEYCTLHKRLLFDCASIQESTEAYFPSEATNALVKDLWEIIGATLTVLELRPLLLTCRTLFSLYTEDNWYKQPQRLRYLLIEKRTTRRDKGALVASRFQNAISATIAATRGND